MNLLLVTIITHTGYPSRQVYFNYIFFNAIVFIDCRFAASVSKGM